MSLQQAPVYIFIAPFAAAFVAIFFSKNKVLSHLIASTALFLSSAASLYALIGLRGGQVIEYWMGGWKPPYGIEWRLDALSALFCLLVSSLAFLVTLSTRRNVRIEIGEGGMPYYATVLLLVSGLLGILMTHDLFNLFVFIEVASLTGYALIASGDRVRGNVSSLRYLFIGTVGASFYLLGVGYLYAMTGTLNLSDLAARLPEVMTTRSVFLGMLLIFIGLAIKMGLFPFHGWLPDAYTYASNPATSLIAPIMTKVMIYAFIRVFYTLFGNAPEVFRQLSIILVPMGIAAIVCGSVLAFTQKKLQRMLAYSSISHIGLIMVGIGLHNKIAFIGAVLHILNHAVMKASLFLIATAAYEKHGVLDIFDLKRIRGKMPHTMWALALTSLSMVGIPPLCGFFSKWYILVGAFQVGQFWIMVAIAASSLLSGLYFFKLLEQAFFLNPSSTDGPQEASKTLLGTYGILSLGLLVLGFYAPAMAHWIFTTILPAVKL